MLNEYAWSQASRRMGSVRARFTQRLMKKLMPEWRRIVPGIIRAFVKLKKTYGV